jgi:hypothetical protein
VYTKAPFQYSASIFHCSYLELHISDQAKYYQNTWASSKHFGLPPNYALGSSSSNHPQRTIESYAKAVNFTFDNSNIRSPDKSSGLASSVISGFHPPHNFHKRNQLEN